MADEKEPAKALPRALVIPAGREGVRLFFQRTKIASGRVVDLAREDSSGLRSMLEVTRFGRSFAEQKPEADFDQGLEDLVPKEQRCDGNGILVAERDLETGIVTARGSSFFMQDGLAAAAVENYVLESRLRSVLTSTLPALLEDWLHEMKGRVRVPTAGDVATALRGGRPR